MSDSADFNVVFTTSRRGRVLQSACVLMVACTRSYPVTTLQCITRVEGEKAADALLLHGLILRPRAMRNGSRHAHHKVLGRSNRRSVGKGCSFLPVHAISYSGICLLCKLLDESPVENGESAKALFRIGPSTP